MEFLKNKIYKKLKIKSFLSHYFVKKDLAKTDTILEIKI